MAMFTTQGDECATSPTHPRILLLAARADTHAASLTTTLNALVELEKFLSLERDPDDEHMAQLQSSLGRLMRALHEDMQRRIGLVADAMAELRAVVEMKPLR